MHVKQVRKQSTVRPDKANKIQGKLAEKDKKAELYISYTTN